jgi:hypothetical protein
VADEVAQQQEYERYLDERRQYIDAARESARTFDKAVLTFGSAVFGFSIAFVKDVAPIPAPDTLKWLGAAWLSFALGLLAILLSFLFSHRACMFEIGACEEALAAADRGSANANSQRKKNPWSIATNLCNFVCIAFLFFGLVCWSKFAIDNLSQGGQVMSKGESGYVKKGYVPPAPPKAPPQQQAPQQPTTPGPPANTPKK